MQAKQRLYLTRDSKRLVVQGDPGAATLYCVPGDEIPQSAVDRFGLVEGGLKERPAKEDRGGKDKEDRGGKDKGSDHPVDDLSRIAGVGPATIKALRKAGLDSFAKIAAHDIVNAPAVEGLPAAFNWAAITQAATALLPPADPALVQG